MLESIDPETAVEEYLHSRQNDCADSTVRNHRYRLNRFIEWADTVDMTDMSDLSGRDCERFKQWWIDEADINDVTTEEHLRTFRVFVRYCESIDAVRPGTAEKIMIPTIKASKAVDETTIETERANAIVDYLVRMEWATSAHIVFHMIWHTGCRRGAIRTLDLEDYHPSDGYVSFRHRPETETPLKLKEAGERNVSITDDRLIDAIDDYITYNRFEKTDEYGREPLITTRYGRISTNTIQNRIYQATRPCIRTGECPHDRVIEECDAMVSDGASKCPSSVSPHPVRRASITAHLNEDVPKEIASERMSVSVDTLEKHYDARSKEDKRELRKDYLGNL